MSVAMLYKLEADGPCIIASSNLHVYITVAVSKLAPLTEQERVWLRPATAAVALFTVTVKVGAKDNKIADLDKDSFYDIVIVGFTIVS